MHSLNVCSRLIRHTNWVLTFIAFFLFIVDTHGQVLKLGVPVAYHPKPFTHPGLLHSISDLQRMKDMVAIGREPWKSAFEKFKLHPWSSASCEPHAVQHVERSLLIGAGKNIGNLEKDV